ncbi:MAG: hypothetical protein JSV10_11100 [Candidatus Zixiibacteriota bacterium]|nr:MAG: hypothetical protein JSV10_11100 [candidate division Zixibacteria bacterium]
MNLYRDQVEGLNKKVPLLDGSLTRYVNLDNLGEYLPEDFGFDYRTYFDFSTE